ncbi:RNA-directed DNA polymerase, eukaryota [Tanacetum coccineum]|uniref:RNA-directed DNA polymerase, eukaryota n=1 Tax=Tanacetum coccineum TaxID=301880 RepID=A0ABQ4WDJ5_9ASTR
MINGIMVEGTWTTDPSLIKDAFFQFYKEKFQAQDSQVLFPNLPHSHTLNSTERDYLERMVTLEEIKEAAWDCGSSKAPGPDGFSISIIPSSPQIKACLSSSRASILVNGSPTSELCNNRGLRQGDPLSLFLLILVMEGLHNAFAEAVGVNEEEVSNMASNAGCIAGNIPFNYLGLSIGSNMKSIASWKMLVDRFHLRLSTWKANLLSIRGRLTLIKLWNSYTFWKDVWAGEAPLFTRYNHLYRLDQDKDCLIIDLNIEVSEDTCVWSLGPKGTFTVKDAHNIIDQKTLPSLAPSTTWDKTIPRKVNIFMWRLSLDRHPHRLNLSLRGMDIPAISCSSCNANVESANHIFFECIIATEM